MTTNHNTITAKNGQQTQTRKPVVIRFKRVKWTIDNLEKPQKGYAVVPRIFFDFGKYLSNNAFRVAVGLFRHANEHTGRCDISVKALAAELGISEDSVKSGQNELEHFKWLARNAQTFSVNTGNFNTRQKNLTYPVVEVSSGHYDLETNGKKYKIVISPASRKEANQYASQKKSKRKKSKPEEEILF